MIGLRKRRILGGVVATVLCIVVFALFNRPAPGSAEEHYERLAYLVAHDDLFKKPVTRRDYFRLSTLRHYAAGQPSVGAYVKECEDHQLALIKMGVFERREFTLSQRRIDGDFLTNFSNALSKAGCDPLCFKLFDPRLTNWVRITCRKADMPKVERTIRELDRVK